MEWCQATSLGSAEWLAFAFLFTSTSPTSSYFLSLTLHHLNILILHGYSFLHIFSLSLYLSLFAHFPMPSSCMYVCASSVIIVYVTLSLLLPSHYTTSFTIPFPPPFPSLPSADGSFPSCHPPRLMSGPHSSDATYFHRDK